MSPEEYAANVVRHLIASGEHFVDKNYVFHEITETIRTACIEAATVRENAIKDTNFNSNH
jgi:hypothetical protein